MLLIPLLQGGGVLLSGLCRPGLDGASNSKNRAEDQEQQDDERRRKKRKVHFIQISIYAPDVRVVR